MVAWHLLGTENPPLSEWRMIGDIAVLGSETYRLTFSGEWTGTSYLLLRYLYGNLEVSPVYKFFPQQEKLVFSMPVPRTFFESDLAYWVRHIQCKRVWTRLGWRRANAGYVRDDWAFSLEEDTDSAPNYDNSSLFQAVQRVEQKIDNLEIDLRLDI